MIEVFAVIVFFMLISVFILMVRSGAGFIRILFLSLFSVLIVVEIILYAIHTQQSMYLDIALAFSLLSFMDVQFYAVYLRRKGAL